MIMLYDIFLKDQIQVTYSWTYAVTYDVVVGMATKRKVTQVLASIMLRKNIESTFISIIWVILNATAILF